MFATNTGTCSLLSPRNGSHQKELRHREDRLTDHKEAIKDAIQAARHSGLSSGEIIQIVEVEFTKTDETSGASKKAIKSEDEVWNPLTEDLKKSKQ